MAARKRKSASHTSPTITDVARRAGVSRTAVSYVLNDNGQRNKHVSDEARAKVLQAVQELHFHPDALRCKGVEGSARDQDNLLALPLAERTRKGIWVKMQLLHGL